jgi:hypothetical protein
MIGESEASRPASPLPARRWRRRGTGLKDLALVVVGLLVFNLLKKLHRDGLLLPSLSRWQFAGVGLGALLVLALAIYLLDRRSRSGRTPPPPT